MASSTPSYDTVKALLKDIIRFEKKKLVLPVFMSLLILVGVAGGMSLRENYVQEELTPRLQTSVELSAVFVEHKYFNDSINETLRERQERLVNDRSIGPPQSAWYLPTYAALRVMYDTPLTPLTPSSPVVIDAGKGVLFRRSSGYYLSKDIPISFAEALYRIDRIKELDRQINQSRENWTLSEFRSKVEQIRSIEYPDQEIIEYYQDFNGSEAGSGFGGSLAAENLYENIANKRVMEVQAYHFIPSLAATFLIYYILSGVLVAGFRRIR